MYDFCCYVLRNSKNKNMTKNTYPDWVLVHKVKGTEIRKFGQKYYLYKVSAFWDKEKKKSRKKTICLLGRITEQGLLASKPRLSPEKANQITVLESGMSEYLYEQNQDILQSLEKNFPKEGKALFLLALFRLGYQSPLKNMSFYYETSYINQVLPNVSLSKNNLTILLKEVGLQRSCISQCLKDLMGNVSYVLLDQTHVVSLSTQMECNRLDYNSQRSFDPQVNLLFIFSPESKVPLYYRMLAGDIRETKALKMTVEESGLKEAIVIGDKGFYSAENLKNLENEDLDYILPLRRSHSLCDYEVIIKGNKKDFDGFFVFEERIIWYKLYEKNGHHLALFLDEELKQQEEKDYLFRIKEEQTQDTSIENTTILPKDTTPNQETEAKTANDVSQKNEKTGNSLEKFYEKQYGMGTIVLEYKLKKNKNGQEIFTYYKSRNEVENTFDAYKNILESDRTYMQGQAQMETWTFINFLALIMYFRIYKTLSEKQMLKNYAPKDILLFLAHIKKLKINNNWLQAEITQKSQKIIDLLRKN
ncbi:MAG: hypothetical protein EAZ27_13675 [Cytophagales bacterium]|nr:MAG: hypothetical protein EAZ27_13675 [Cytophagales bacterium]